MAETVTSRSKRKARLGTVVSNKMDKSIVVRVDRTMKHPLYLKVLQRSSKLYAHDEKNEANVGDMVRVMETRPMSRTKRWRLVEIVEKAK
jgi:small subunit ribosomal protein S17